MRWLYGIWKEKEKKKKHIFEEGGVGFFEPRAHARSFINGVPPSLYHPKLPSFFSSNNTFRLMEMYSNSSVFFN